MNAPMIDQLAILTVYESQAEPLRKELTRQDFHFTVINSTGGIVQEPIVCLMIGFSQKRIAELLAIVRANCRSYRKYIPAQGLLPGESTALPMLEAQAGGALLYMMNVERVEQI